MIYPQPLGYLGRFRHDHAYPVEIHVRAEVYVLPGISTVFFLEERHEADIRSTVHHVACVR